ncbi:MAG: P-loop NTPase fold protein [Candidatus Gastranaerophilaceae bacterium]|nr:P-loop NTPase fold protein [Candidatus Gastranaerophilaceae bacterium]
MAKTLFLHDSNNIKAVKDSFGIHSKIADTIVDIANNEELKNCSFNLGLFGSWGSGKSYIINNIISKLKDNYAIFNIDVWKYVGQPLMRSILFDMDTQLKKSKLGVYNDGYVNDKNNSLEKLLYADTDFEEEIDLEWNELCQKLSPIIKYLVFTALLIAIFSIISCYFGNEWLKSLSIPIFSGLGFISAPLLLIVLLKKQLLDLTKTIFCSKKIKTYTYKPTFSPEQFENIFNDIVANISSKKEKKVLIIFDNLDRCEPKYAYETLSAIKTFMDKENCLYIIPCDDIAIKKYISASYNIKAKEDEYDFSQTIGEEFFDKLFNTYIRIPQLQEIDRDVFIEEQLKDLSIYSDIESNINEIKQVLFYGYRGSTPRQIKRFINDFSINYVLAENIDPEHKFLLNNITLFAIMIVIKQKWNTTEELLIRDPDLFSKNIDNDDYKLFISRIKNLLPNRIPSLMPFIYLKETIDAKAVSMELKDGDFIENINDNVVNRIKTEVQQMLDSNESTYLQNASIVIFNSLDNEELDEKNTYQLIRILSYILASDNIKFVDFIEGIFDELDRFISYIPQMREKQSSTIKNLLSKYLKMNKEDDKLGNETILSNESKVLLFDKLTNNFNIFDKNYISAIFKDFKNISQINESIQKYIEILNAKNQLSLIPSEFISFAINTVSKDTFSDNIINCLKYYDRNSLDIDCKKELAQKLNTIITAIHRSSGSYANQISLLDGIKLSLSLIDKDCFELNTLNNFNVALYDFINNLFPYNPNFAMYILVEVMTLVNEETDSNYENILRAHLGPIDNQNAFIKILIDNNYQSHVKNIIQYDNSKRFLFGIAKIKRSIYEFVKESISELYQQLLREDDSSMDDLKTLLEVITKDNIKINKEKFKDYILSKYYNADNIEKIFSLYELLNNNNIKILEKDFTPIKNKTIEAYKKDPKSGIRYLQIASDILTEKQFNNIFLTPILKYIYNELEATKSVSIYSNIVNITNSESFSINEELFKNIVSMLLEDSQEPAEYEFACNLVSLLSDNSIDVKDFQKAVLLRLNNINSNLRTKMNEIFTN